MTETESDSGILPIGIGTLIVFVALLFVAIFGTFFIAVMSLVHRVRGTEPSNNDSDTNTDDE